MTNYQQPPGGYPPVPQQGYAPAPQPGYAPPQQYAPQPQQQPQYAPPQQPQYAPPPQQPQYAPPPQQPQYAPQPQFQPPWPGAPAPGPSQGYRQPQGYAPAPSAGNPMAGLGDADPTGSRLPHFNAGRRYVLKNEKIEFFQGRSDNYVTSEWMILESDDPMLPPGRSGKYMIKWDQDMSLPNFKGMLGALMGMSDKNEMTTRIGEKEGAEAIDANLQPHRGKLVELRTEAIKTKSNNDFTVHNWYPHSGAAAGMSPAPMMAPPAAAAAPWVSTAAPAQWTPDAGQQYAPMGAAAAPPPYVPPAAQAPAPAAFVPPPGWYPHQQPGYFHNTKEAITEAELRQRMIQGRA